ncbi:telomerase reverse transcriptase-like isoform X2 [Odontomachus brunneus]|nr:telomerase reverse transcriptase-like isoform X2 [Odontomachus brunneus]
MSTNVGLRKYDNNIEKNINFANIASIVSPILEKFKRQHNIFKYSNELKNIIKADKKPTKQKYKGQIRICLLKIFFGLVLYQNVPFQLFGTRQNLKAVKKCIYCLLKTDPKKIQISDKLSLAINKKGTFKNANGGLLNIDPLLEKLDISKIEWLHPLKSIKQKWIVILKLLHWFFAQYIIKILHKYIVLIPSRNKWLFIMKEEWYQIQHKFINEKINNGYILLKKPVKNEKYNKLSVNRLTTSSSGLRIITKCNFEKTSFEIEIILRFLQQLYHTYINEKGIPTVKGCIQQIYNFKKTLSTHHLYYVRCDIQDAFGSIRQEKLCNIIKDCCKKHLPLYIVMREYKKKDKNMRKQQIMRTVQFLDMKLLKGNIGASIAKKPQLVNWLKLTYKIKKMLLKKTIKLYGKIYSIKIGVPQGLRLSSIFSDIYYQDMFNKLLSQFNNNGLVCRYVDDILYITKEKNYAEQFLEIIRNGIIDYNVRFNKIQTNLESTKFNKINYLGRKIFI